MKIQNRAPYGFGKPLWLLAQRQNLLAITFVIALRRRAASRPFETQTGSDAVSPWTLSVRPPGFETAPRTFGAGRQGRWRSSRETTSWVDPPPCASRQGVKPAARIKSRITRCDMKRCNVSRAKGRMRLVASLRSTARWRDPSVRPVLANRELLIILLFSSVPRPACGITSAQLPALFDCGAPPKGDCLGSEGNRSDHG